MSQGARYWLLWKSYICFCILWLLSLFLLSLLLLLLSLGFLNKNSLLFLWSKLNVCFCFLQFRLVLKSDSHPSRKFFTCFNDNCSEVMKNAFYFVLIALFVLKIFKFLSWVFGHVEKLAWLERYVSFEIYDVTAWSTNNYNTPILFNISRIKGNQVIWPLNITKEIFSSKSCS